MLTRSVLGIALLLFAAVYYVSCEKRQCQMIPMETEGGVVGYCCVFTKNLQDVDRLKQDILDRLLGVEGYKSTGNNSPIETRNITNHTKIPGVNKSGVANKTKVEAGNKTGGNIANKNEQTDNNQEGIIYFPKDDNTTNTFLSEESAFVNFSIPHKNYNVDVKKTSSSNSTGETKSDTSGKSGIEFPNRNNIDHPDTCTSGKNVDHNGVCVDVA